MAEGSEQEEPACSLYISPSSPGPGEKGADEGDEPRAIPLAALEEVVRSLEPVGRWQVTATGCGLIASFAADTDADRLLATDLAAALGGPVQVARFSAQDARYRQTVLVRDIPWAIPLQDVAGALAKQGITVGKIERVRQHVRVEVLDAGQYENLLRQGLDFFGAARFTVVPERLWRTGSSPGPGGRFNNGSAPGDYPQQDNVLQCYRCQGFWHVAANCRHLPRCVRCGEPHSVQFCPRPRHDPICCHCAGPHHAAYKQCPVRLQLMNATPVSITLSSERTPRNKPLWAGGR